MMRIKFFRSERGISALEFTLVGPLLFMLLFGMIEFSFLIYNQQVITNASREGARFGIVLADPPITEADIQNIVLAYCSTYLINFDTTDPAPTVTTNGNCSGSFGTDCEVTVNYNYQWLILPNLVGAILPNPFPISASTLMKNE